MKSKQTVSEISMNHTELFFFIYLNQMGYILGNTRQSRNVRDTFTKKEKAGGKGR